MSPRTQRAWGAGFAAVLGLLAFIVYYSIFSVGLALADKGSIPIAVALWTPNLLTLILASVVLYKLGTEQWSSVSEGIQSYCLKAAHYLRGILGRR
jgi:lipopolysaccharide export system permease protein